MTQGLLYGWELGGGASHLELARGLLAALGGRFERVTLALRRLASAQARFGPAVQLFQSPVPEPAGMLPNPASYAEILLEAGFHDRDALLSRLRAWDAILDAARPDVLVADHAPTLLLAILSETLCPLLIALGVLTRLACLPIIATLLVAMLVVHPDWSLADGQFGWMLLIIFTTVLIAGPGRFSIFPKY